MAGSYRRYEPDQVMLLPAAPQDWLPAGHLARFISDKVDALDLKAFYARYEGGGSRNQPFHPGPRCWSTPMRRACSARARSSAGVPEDKTQENFTDPDSRIMKRAGGGFDPAYNAQTAVDEAAHIIVAAELDNTAPDANWLLPMIRAVGDNLGELPALGLADGLPQAQVDRRPTERVDQERAGVPAVQHAGSAPGPRGVEARVHGAEPAAYGSDGGVRRTTRPPRQALTGSLHAPHTRPDRPKATAATP
jgi:hypothetical protein